MNKHGAMVTITRHIEKVLGQRSIDPDEFSFAVLSDVHIWERKTKWTDPVFRDLLQRCTDAGAAFIFLAGDFGTQQTEAPRGAGVTGLADVVAETIGLVSNCPPVFFGIGNHELDDAGKRYWLEAIYPNVVTDLEGSGNDRFIYFSFNVGACHFVSLDSHGTVPGMAPMRIKTDNSHFARIPDEQFAWLEQDLEAHRGELTFVFMHEPSEQVEHQRPWHMLQTRGRLIGTLQRFPHVRWLFHGHTHHYSQVEGYGLKICHMDFQSGYLVRIRDGAAALHDLNDELTRPTFLDLAAHQQSRWLERAGTSRLPGGTRRARGRVVAVCSDRNDKGGRFGEVAGWRFHAARRITGCGPWGRRSGPGRISGHGLHSGYQTRHHVQLQDLFRPGVGARPFCPVAVDQYLR